MRPALILNESDLACYGNAQEGNETVLPFNFKSRNYELSDLVFRTEVDFFTYHCKLAHEHIEPNQGVVAIVLDGTREFGQGSPVKIASDAKQTAKLKVASKDGGYPVIADTPKGKGERLTPGDLVLWVPTAHLGKEFKKHGYRGDMRSAWEGYITAKLRPILLRKSNGFSVICSYA